jgi:large subunit ribosomal protein L30
MADKKIFLRQVRSTTRTKQDQVRTLQALGLGKLGKVNLLNDNPAVRGMIRTVLQWVEVKHV